MEAQHRNDWEAENEAIRVYNEDIALAVEVGDNGTRELLESILVDEEAHLVVLLLIANAVQNAMVGPDTSLTGDRIGYDYIARWAREVPLG